MGENKNNTLPRYKIGQILTYKETANYKGFEAPVKISGIITKIEIIKKRPRLRYLSPTIIYTMCSEQDQHCAWTVDEDFLIKRNPQVTQGYAVDDKTFDPCFLGESSGQLENELRAEIERTKADCARFERSAEKGRKLLDKCKLEKHEESTVSIALGHKMQREIDALKQDNSKLRAALSAAERNNK